MATMLYQGHGSYRFITADGTVVYVDPFAGEGYDVPADVIFVTHEHPDHNQIDLMPHADGCTIVRAADIHPAKDEYLSIKTHGVRASAVQAYNGNHPAESCVGLVLKLDGVSFYASGDTSMTEDMKSGKLAALGLDYAVFPCDGFYNMGVDEAIECAKLVEARHSIPVHMVPAHAGEKPGLFDRAIAETFEVPGRIIVADGEQLELQTS